MLDNKISISVIVPTLNAEKEIDNLLYSILNQSIKVDEIIVVDSESTDLTVQKAESFSGVKVIKIKRSEFDHGRTRDLAIKQSLGQYVIFLTQDVELYDKDCFRYLFEATNLIGVACAFAKQEPRINATLKESLIRKFNYPSSNRVVSKDDIKKFGIKIFFFSDVCAIYNKDIYFKLGGFNYPIKTNEDMLYATKVINAGYKVAYVADAKVRHSHDFSLKEQYYRNFIQGYELERHKKFFCGASANGEGFRLVKFVSLNLLKGFHFIELFYFVADCIARFLGNKKGKQSYLKDFQGRL